MTELSKSLQAFWNNQIANDNDVKAAPFSGNCMFCNNAITEIKMRITLFATLVGQI